MRKRGNDYWDRFLATDQIELMKFFNAELEFNEKKIFFKNTVEVINIETSSSCNRKCLYCPVSIVDRKKLILIDDTILKNLLIELADINYSNNISLNLYNEPLMDQDFINKLKLVKRFLPKSFLSFNTNGDYFNKENLNHLLNSDVDEIRVTLHSDKKIYSLEKQVLRYRKFFKQINLEQNFLEKIIVDENQNMHINIDFGKTNLLIMSNNWAEFGNDRGGTIKNLSLEKNRVNPCMKPIREVTIGYDGYIYPCCQVIPDEINKELRIGNLNKSSLFELYFNDFSNKFKKSMFVYGEKMYSPCNSCADPDNSKIETNFIRQNIINSSENG
jgi:radical SAM protein with 4Fe4S-binding SPASM domain